MAFSVLKKVPSKWVIKWKASSKKLSSELKMLKHKWKEAGYNVRIEESHYESIPQRHGFLIDGSYLFLSHLDWN